MSSTPRIKKVSVVVLACAVSITMTTLPAQAQVITAPSDEASASSSATAEPDPAPPNPAPPNPAPPNPAPPNPAPPNPAPAPKLAPGAPMNVKAVAGHGSATITWSAPASDGGSAITNYRVTSADGLAICSVPGATLECKSDQLSNGTVYAFKVVATNSTGVTSPASAASNPVTPVGAPTVPTNASAEAGASGATVSWTAPTNAGGSPIETYTVTAVAVGGDGGGQTCEVSATTCEISGLTEGTKYSFTVKATNQAGLASPVSNPSSPVVVGQVGPSQPTNVNGVSEKGGSAVTVSWNAPDSPGGSNLEKYVVTAATADGKSVDQSCSTTRVLLIAPATHCTVKGLTDGVGYVFQVVAWNKQAASSPSENSPVVTPVGPPAAPTAVTAKPGDGSAEVSWTAPPSGGSDITGYTVYSTSGKQKCSPSPVSTSCTVTGLPNGSAVSFKVEATNSSGTGPESAASDPVTPAGKPGAPTAVAVTVQGDSAATATWKAPKSDGGSAVTSFTATAFEGTDSRGQCTAGADKLTCQINGLNAGTTYTISVTATNAVATSDPSGASHPFTPGQNNPAQPTDVAAVAGNAQITATWSAPNTSGNSSIKSYTATATPQGDGNAEAASCTVGTGIFSKTTCVITSLVNGTPYVVTVTASNASGTSAPSDPAAAVTPSGPPTVAQNVTATPGNASATINWDPPGSDGGTPIAGYVATATAGTGKSATKLTCSTTSDTSCTITEMVNDTAYTVTVTSSNQAKLSSVATGPTVTPVGPPSEPQAASGKVGDGEVTVTWKAPKSNGGSPITNYNVTASDDAGSCSTDGSGTSCVVTGLTDGTAYTFTVTATNSAGVGPGATTAELTPARTASEPPTNVVATPGDAQATVTWDKPGDTGKGIDLHYEVQTVGDSPLTCKTLTALTKTCKVSGLTNGTEYQFQARLVTTAGTSDWSAASGGVTPGGPPGPATGVTAQPQDASAVVSWTAPENTGGSGIGGYQVTTYAGNTKGKQTCSADGSTTSCTVSGLSNGTAYDFVVVTSSVSKQTSTSTPSSPVTPFGPISPPTKLKASTSNGAVVLAWNAPASTGGTPIASYQVSSSPESAGCSVVSPAVTCTVSNLTNHTEYTFTVTATNSSDPSQTSGPSNEVKATPGKFAPDAPTDLKVTPGNGKVDVSWTAPASGGPVEYTVVSASPGDKTCRALAGITRCTVSGLTNGSGYTFVAQATNLLQVTSPESAPSESVVPAAVPSAPLDVVAAPANNAINVAWQPPTSDGGAAITGYTASATGGGKTSTCSTTTEDACTIDQLKNGTSYAVKVVATNDVGPSKAGSAKSKVEPTGPPPAPTDVIATAGPVDIIAQWTAPASSGTRVSGYVATATPTSSGTPGTCSTSAIWPFTPSTKCTINSLDPEVQYAVTVVATSAEGNSAPSQPSNPVNPGTTTPGAPQNPTASSDAAGQALVGWEAPSMHGSSMITSYEATAIPGGKTCSTTFYKSCTVKGLTNGTAYTFTVRAYNSYGYGEPSVPTASVTPKGPPTAPLSPKAVAGDGEVIASWSPPASDGGTPVTGYTVQARSYFDFVKGTCTTTTTTCTIGGITDGSSYTIRVFATNGAEGPWSANSNSVTPAGLPGAPTAVTATGESGGRASVSWTAPENTGGVNIQSYLVKSANTSGAPNGTCETTRGILAPSTNCTVKNLSSASQYTFTVVATNKVGAGPASAPSSPIKPSGGGKPTAPQNPTAASNASQQATISWQPPADSGGDAVTSYQVTVAYNLSPKTCTAAAPRLNCTITGLINGYQYQFDVTATSASGTSPSARSPQITVVGPPPAPLGAGIYATGGKNSLAVEWLPPALSGAPVTSYLAKAIPGGQSCKATSQRAGTPPDTFCTIPGLKAGESYKVSVSATNRIGTGPAGTSLTKFKVPGGPPAPTGVKAELRGSTVVLTWATSFNPLAPAVKTFTVTPSSPHLTATCSPVPGAKKTCTIFGVPRGVPARWKVRGTSDLGVEGSYSAPSNAVIVRSTTTLRVAQRVEANNADALHIQAHTIGGANPRAARVTVNGRPLAPVKLAPSGAGNTRVRLVPRKVNKIVVAVPGAKPVTLTARGR